MKNIFLILVLLQSILFVVGYDEYYSDISFLVVCILVVKFVLIVNKKRPEIKTLSMLLTSIILYAVILFYGYEKNIITDIIFFGIFIFSFVDTPKQIHKPNLTVIVVSLILVFLFIFTYIDEFKIPERYIEYPKNQYGLLFGGLCLYFFKLFSERRNKLYILISIIFFTVLLFLRSRSSIIPVVMIAAYWSYSNIRFKVLWFAVVFLILYSSFDLIYEVFTLNYDVSSAESLSAGRLETIFHALNDIYNNPFSRSHINRQLNPHNYIVFVFYNYGIIIAPIVLALAYYVIKYTFSKLNSQYGRSLLLMILFISFFEYSYPFSPLTTIGFVLLID